MNGLEILRGYRGLVSSAQSSFQGRRLSKATDASAALARRVSRMGLTPVAVAEVTNVAEQRGKSALKCDVLDFLQQLKDNELYDMFFARYFLS
jgi:hypothetical protein